MAKTLPRELKRLFLQVERDLLAQGRLRSLLTTATETTAGHRRELRSIKARLKRAQPSKSRSKKR